MNSRGFAVTLAGLVLATTSAPAQDAAIMDYHEESDYLPETPSVTGGSVSAFGNPAAWGTVRSADLAFWWNDRALGDGGLGNWGLSFGKNAGFAVQRQRFDYLGGRQTVYDYQLGVAGGNRRGHVGLAFRWATAGGSTVGRENNLAIGGIFRPNPFVTYGLAGMFSTESSARQGVFDLGIRPLGTPHVTVFGDYTLRTGESLGDGRWGAGARLQPWQGVNLGAKLREETGDQDYRFTLNFGLILDGKGLNVLPDYDEDGNLGATNYLIRSNPPQGGVPVGKWMREKMGPRRYVAVNLENRLLTYQHRRWFDRQRVAWLELAPRLDRLRDEPSVRGVALNLAGFRTTAALAWELRHKLEELRAAGKEIVVHADRLSFLGYYLASVADHITLDPEGYVRLSGVAAYRTYYQQSLEKLGLGFEELRFFSHKSAMETYSRSDMSDGDREQLGRMIDVIYEEVRRGVIDRRGFGPDRFDEIVDEEVLLTSGMALENRLVDRVARWSDLRAWLETERSGAWLVGLPSVEEPAPDERWGRPPEIAVVYAVGECDMDRGIRGRATAAHLRRLARDGDVKAVVLRVDSPGGDPLPSDLVADAVRAIRRRGKPVVVTQGSVAASGGYWISVDGSRVLTTPFTVTGSIGVAGGWVWDESLHEKTGITADGVQRGAHADLFAGARYPLIPIQVPHRNLTPEEKAKVGERFHALYDRFVSRVATGRELGEDAVRKLGEGQTWMGDDAVANGLCDELGTLDGAVRIARELAGIEADRETILDVYPEPSLFGVPGYARFLPGVGGHLAALLAGAGDGAGLPAPSFLDYGLVYLESVISTPGEPLLLTPVDALPGPWRRIENDDAPDRLSGLVREPAP